MTIKRCGNCRFMEDGPPMHCRRGPPSAVSHNSSSFPVVDTHMWCHGFTPSLTGLAKNWFVGAQPVTEEHGA